MQMCVAATLLLCITWWLTGEWYAKSKPGNVRMRYGARDESYDEVRTEVEKDLKWMESAETASGNAIAQLKASSTASVENQERRIDAIKSQVENWASLLKKAREDLSNLESSTLSKVRKMKLALESAEVARRKSAAKLLAVQSSQLSLGNPIKMKPSHGIEEAIPGPALVSSAAAAIAATSAYNEYSALTLPPLRIYVYDLPKEFNTDLSRNNPDCRWDSPYTWQTKYTLEVYLHEMFLISEMRTLDPNEADLFYMPVYVGCFLHSHGTNFIKTQNLILRAQKWARSHFAYWDRLQGRDHVFTLTHDIGACIAPFQELRHAILITNTGELLNRKAAFSVYTDMYTKGYKDVHDLSLPCFNPWKDIVAPPMINDEYMLNWHKAKKQERRNLLATFRGTIIDRPGWKFYSRGIRQRWLKKYEFDEKIKITAVHPREGFGKKAAHYQATYRQDFLSSKYCLCPPGWATWTPRLYEALLLGCIPAIIADHNLLPFSRTIDYSKFSVHISEDRANDLDDLLPQSDARVMELQNGVDNVWKAFVYNKPPKPGDAFHRIAAELFWKSRSLQRGQSWNKETFN